MWLAERPRSFPMSISPVCGYGAIGFIEYPSATCLHTGGGSFGVIGSSGQAGATGSFGTVVYPGMTGTAACSGTTDTIGTIDTAGTVGTTTYSGTTGTTGTAAYSGTTGAAVTKGRSGTWRPPAVTCPKVAVPMMSAATVCHVTVAIAPC
ncbi:hypothetical protein GCM10027187_51420 [Streptosporangium sandarakinum]